MNCIPIFYQIEEQNKYYASGKIQCITQRDETSWKSLVQDTKVSLKLILKTPAKIQKIQIRALNTNCINVLYRLKGAVVEESLKLYHQKKQGQPLVWQKKSEKTSDELQIQFHNCKVKTGEAQKLINIYYVMLHGIIDPKVCRKQCKSYAKMKNTPQKNQQEKQMRDQKKFQLYEQSQSEKEDKQPFKMPNKADIFFQSQNSSCDSYKEEEIAPTYRTIRVKKEDLQIFRFVSKEWIAAQKKIQHSLNIRSQHQLSIKVNKKCLKNLSFCLMNLSKKDSQHLMKLGKELGANFIEQPKENCVIVCKKREGDKIGIARLMKNVTFVTPPYIIDCYSKKTKLTYRKYCPPEGLYF